MAFHNVVFPTALKVGSKGGPEFAVDVFEHSLSGAEQRNLYHSHGRRRYAPEKGSVTKADFYELLAFWHARYGKAHSFLFKDPGDYATTDTGNTDEGSNWVQQFLGYGSSAIELEFQLVKVYGSSPYTFTRTITKPIDNDNLKVFIDGMELESAGAWSVDTTTGIITFDSGAAPEDGEEVTAQFEFYVPVRFNMDRFEPEAGGPEHFNIGNLELIEVIGE